VQHKIRVLNEFKFFWNEQTTPQSQFHTFSVAYVACSLLPKLQNCYFPTLCLIYYHSCSPYEVKEPRARFPYIFGCFMMRICQGVYQELQSWNKRQRKKHDPVRTCSSCSLTQIKYTVNTRQQHSVGIFMLLSNLRNYSMNIEQSFINLPTIVARVFKNNGNQFIIRNSD